MTITVNGAERALSGALTIDELLLDLKLRRELVAVELNRQIVRRVNYGEQRVGAGDQVEIVEFVGGG
jgi:thiamine biosynthesis protein ThiS